MKCFCRISVVLALFLCSSSAFAQMQVSGLSDILFKNAEEKDVTNLTFLGFSNFHSLRTRLFFDGTIDRDVYFFAQILVDNLTGFQLYAAYARFQNLSGPKLNLQLGLIPATIGSFAPRTYSDKNPLVGVPLLYNFHTAINPRSLGSSGTLAELSAAKDARSRGGLPVIYDACWNTGIEIYGSAGNLDYSFGILSGSVSKPTVDQTKEIPQFTSRFVYNFGPGLKFGASAYYGPYLFEEIFGEGDILENTQFRSSDFINAGIGYELYYAKRYLEIFSEAFYSTWEYPGLPDLDLISGYFEFKYKFRPRWYIAGRFGLSEPAEIETAPGISEKWDYPLKRYEFGLGYKALRKMTIKLVTQINRFDQIDSFDNQLIALQISSVFN
ncbi:MAG: hypothetical protein IIA17_00975 [candidate division Zixibacteria bacterium]|nr:hypothetical protein [candidate division Zixibacteria bacterium]